MLDKLNLYDLLAYLIPGGVVLGLGYWLGNDVLTGHLPGFRSDLLDFASSLGGSIVFIALSYALGHLVQSVGERWENRGNRKRKCCPSEPKECRLSEQMMLPTCQEFYTAEAQDLIREQARKAFKFPRFPHSHDPTYIPRLRELFELCYRDIVNKGFDQHTEIYLAIAGLSRGLMVSAWLGLSLSILLALKEVLANRFPGGLGTLKLAAADMNQFLAGLGLIVFFLASWYVFRFHYFRFRKLFATSVWNSFMASHA